MKRFQAHTDYLYRIKQSPFNTNHVATCSYDKTTHQNMGLVKWTLIRSYTQHTSRVYGIDFIDEDTIASGSKDQTIKIWSLSSGQTIRTMNANSEVNCLKLLNNRIHLTVGLLSGDINIYSINDGS
jgi:WD40 repeat protein